MNGTSKATMVREQLPFIRELASKGTSQQEIRKLLSNTLGTHISVGTYYNQLRKANMVSGKPRVAKVGKYEGTTEIELSSQQIGRLAKGKAVTEGQFTIKPRAISYKELYESARSQVYNLRYRYNRLLKQHK